MLIAGKESILCSQEVLENGWAPKTYGWRNSHATDTITKQSITNRLI
jgi:hypothetical protein